MATPPRLDRVDLLTLLALGGLWGSAFVVIRAGLLAGATPFAYADVRYLIAAVAALALALGLRQPRPSRSLLLRAALLGGFSLVGGYAILVYWGETTTGGGLSAVLVATVPLWTGVIGHPFLPGERFGRLGWVGIAAGFGGVVLLLSPQLIAENAAGLAGPVALVSAALLFSVGSIILRRLGGGPEGYWSFFAQFAASTAVLLPFALLAERPSVPATPFLLGTLLYLALGSSLLGFLLYFRLHHRVGPARAGFVTYVSPVVGLALGISVLAEPFSWVEVGGFGLIVVGILLVRWERSVGSARSTPPPERPALEAASPSETAGREEPQS